MLLSFFFFKDYYGLFPSPAIINLYLPMFKIRNALGFQT